VEQTGRLRRWGRAGAAFTGALSLLALAPAAAPASAGGAHASIIGGTPASIADFPSLAFVASDDGEGRRFSCTGTVISPRVVLTAAHCVEDLDAGGFTAAADYTVLTGRTNPRQDAGGNALRVSATHVFPRFDPGTGHGDAALLVLATPTPAPPIQLASAADSALYEGGAGVLLAGWGLTRANALSPPKSLRSTASVVLAPRACKSRTRPYYPPYSVSGQMCTADPPDHENGGCFGDSGGPVIGQRADGSPVEIGIVSTGGPFCSTTLPNIFTRADLVSAWASEWIAAVESGGPPPALKARLPRLTEESAEGLVVGVLRTNLGNLFLRNRGLRGGCRRLAATRIRCELLWRHGPKIYLASVTVFYVLRQNTVAWDSSYSVRRASARCLAGDRPRSCRVESKRG
jgi:secreted trypsin-like serine protease